jgi:hypothetical protein
MFVPPVAAAMNARSGELLVYTRGKLVLLKPDAKGRYEIVRERVLETEMWESVALAFGGDHAVLARKNGELQVLDADTLEEISSTSPEDENPPRFVSASPDGKKFAVVFHSGLLWMYDAEEAAWSRPRVAGQGDISAAAWSDKGQLLVADYAKRVSVYAGDTLAVEERYSPRLNIFERIYRWGVVPLYTILPKPGEMYKTFEYLVSGKSTSASDAQADVAQAQAKLRPWAPVWSGLLFIAVVLGVTCLYFERQEY